MNPSTNLSRRALFARTAATAVGAALAAGSASMLGSCASLVAGGPVVTRGRLRHAAIGCGGMGESDLAQISGHAQVDVVALCDVDEERLEAAAQKHPGARRYRDWREMLAKEDGSLDSVHVSIPDHMHAPAMIGALRSGLHVYGQKPLTRTVREARAVAAAARGAGTATQMGIQNRAAPYYRQALALLRAGHIGAVHEVHVWTDRPAGWWPQGVERPAGEDPVPSALEWDLWLGVAPMRPYVKGNYHPFAWRGWRDFGTGAQGDMACHLMDPALWFLELGAPRRIRSEGPPPGPDSYPLWSRVHYEFAPTPHTKGDPVLLTWHDGGKMPRTQLDEIEAGDNVWKNACLFLGEKGALLASPYDPPRLLPESRFAGVELPEVEDRQHWHEWVDACLSGQRLASGFDYSAHLTEVALLGNVALHHPHTTLDWDGRSGQFRQTEANRFLHEPYRRGWEVKGL